MVVQADLRALIRDIPDFPAPGILFRDITPLLGDAAAFGRALDWFAALPAAREATAIVGIESRGFIFGAPVAARLGVGFVPVRKEGKLPHAAHAEEYTLEYGMSTLEIHRDALSAADRVLVVDDLLATGGTARAAARLIEMTGATVAGLAFLIELDELDGRALLPDCPVDALITY